MGVNTRRPPLPAPTESMDETSGADTEVATNVTTRTDKTHYSIPDDGSPITINTDKHTSSRDTLGRHHRQKSQTSLLIEYFEASKTGDKSRARPSVRVKVTPSAHHRKTRSGNDAIQITGIGADRKPSYTRRISLSGHSVDAHLPPTEGTELSRSSESNVSSNRPPVEIEVLHNPSSDVSTGPRSSRGLQYAQVDSNVSSMPPDSILDDHGDDHISIDNSRMTAKSSHRSRSASGNASAEKALDKGDRYTKTRTSSRSNREHEHDLSTTKERRRRSSRSQRSEEEDMTVSGAESSLVSSNLAPSQRSHRSDRSQASHMTNNPKLLEMVEDTIKRMILPEINALKEDKKTDRNLRSLESSSRYDDYDDAQGSQHRVSKSSGSPNLVSKPKVVLNRHGDDPGTVLSRGDSERVKPRGKSRNRETHSSRRRSSGSRHSRESSRHEERTLLTAAALEHHDSQQDLHTRRKNRSKTRGSRSGSVSIGDTALEDDGKLGTAAIPPLPMASQINDSEMTRDSLVSHDRYDQDLDDDRPRSRASLVQTPVREVSRGSIGSGGAAPRSPVSSRTPTRTPLNRALQVGQGERSPGSPRSSLDRISNRSRNTTFAASGLGADPMNINESELNHMNADGYGDVGSPGKTASPVQSVSSLKKRFEEDDALVPRGLRPHSVASRSSAGLLRSKNASQASLPSAESSPRMAPSSPLYKRLESRPPALNDGYDSPVERGSSAQRHERERSGTPSIQGETTEEWFERQHQVNDHYRNSMVSSNNRDSYQTNPYPQDEKRFTSYTEDSLADAQLDEGEAADDKDVHHLGVNPLYVHSSADVESAVASLMDPSVASSNMASSLDSTTKTNASYSDRMAQHIRAHSEDVPAVYQGSTLSQTMPSQDRWAAIKGHARDLSASAERLDSGGASPRQSSTKGAQQETRDITLPSATHTVMTASGVPDLDDPLPEVGHLDHEDSQSELTTNPSIIKGPLGGDITGKDTWPYTPEPARSEDAGDDLESYDDSPRVDHRRGRGDDAVPAAVAGGAAAAAAHAYANHRAQPDVRDATNAQNPQGRFAPEVGPSQRPRKVDAVASPAGSPLAFRDEGYATDGRTRSTGAHTPKADLHYSKKDLEEYTRAMNAQDDDVKAEEDPFTATARQQRHFSGNSHGMSSPLYDSSTGKGLENIQSKDIVALMDHLTVRDAQRNARDTEILVTLVRNATEMRQSFDEMRKFILEQDKLIMQNTDRGAEYSAQKVLSGPRPQPASSPRTPRAQIQTAEETTNKRKGRLRRALQGLTGGKNANDLAKIEDMLNQILDNVEDLRHQGPASLPPRGGSSYARDSIDSYERLRAAPDPGYEPDGQAGTSSTPSHSGHFSIMPREKQQFHSGYDGRRGSEHRVSTVMEDDEDELEAHEAHVLAHQFEHNERLLTPTQEYPRGREISPNLSAAQYNPGSTPEQQRKHKSNGSSMFGGPKISRWSKTTASSAAPDPTTPDGAQLARGQRQSSEASRSSSTLDQYEDREQGNRHHSRQDANTPSVRSSQASMLTRTPSPLIPSEASSRGHANAYYNDQIDAVSQEDEAELDDAMFDDPKYQAHRNSLLLEHPQPRQGPTGRHQNTLETQARTFDDNTGTNSDLSQRTGSDFDPAVWGSTATAGLARHRLSHVEPISPVSMGSPATGRNSGDGPLIPRKPVASNPTYEPEPEPEHEVENDWEPQYSNSGFSKGDYYSSPYGSGHLLEPIAEVRYSLETDSGRISPEPQLASAKAVDMRSPIRKITGPRPMGSRSSPGGAAAAVQQPRLVDNSGTVRRKPLASSQGSLSSLDSETF